MKACACGANVSYQNCCGRYIEQRLLPNTPEALMRSRYTAYTQENLAYIAATMKSPAADSFDLKTALESKGKARWLKLTVLRSSVNDDKGSVEFIAEYLFQGQHITLHEVSEFQLIKGQWFYVDGKTQTSVKKIGRNDTCCCGSGNKFKKCCGV